MRKWLAVGVLALCASCGTHSHPSTYHPKTEDDYPACWRNKGEDREVCGPMWAIDPSIVVKDSVVTID